MTCNTCARRVLMRSLQGHAMTPPSAMRVYIGAAVGVTLLFLAWAVVFVLPHLKGG